MVSAEAVKRSEKKAKSEKKPDNAISEQVDGSFLYTLNLSHANIFWLSTTFCKKNKATAIAKAVVF